MAHRINSIGYYGEEPWHGLGTKVPARADSETMIKAAGLDWRVEKRPIRGARLDAKGRPVKYEIIRRARTPKEYDIPLAHATRKYHLLQNEEAFQFFEPIVGKKAAIFETAGALDDGERLWVMAKLPKEIKVLGDDIVNKYLLLSNSHNAKGAITIKFTPIRVVCHNTLSMALKDGTAHVRVYHTVNMHERLAEVPKIMGIVNNMYETAEETFQMLAKIQVNTMRLLEYLESIYPRTKTQLLKRQYPLQWEAILELFEKGDPDIPQIKGTLWSLYNSITRYIDYRPGREDTPDKRLNRVWFGDGADLKMQALHSAAEMAKLWKGGHPSMN